MLKKNDHQIPKSLADLERLEKEVKKRTENQLHELRVRRAKEMKLTDEMLKLEKANLRSEIRNWIEKLKSIFSSSKT